MKILIKDYVQRLPDDLNTGDDQSHDAFLNSNTTISISSCLKYITTNFEFITKSANLTKFISDISGVTADKDKPDIRKYGFALPSLSDHALSMLKYPYKAMFSLISSYLDVAKIDTKAKNAGDQKIKDYLATLSNLMSDTAIHYFYRVFSINVTYLFVKYDLLMAENTNKSVDFNDISRFVEDDDTIKALMIEISDAYVKLTNNSYGIKINSDIIGFSGNDMDIFLSLCNTVAAEIHNLLDNFIITTKIGELDVNSQDGDIKLKLKTAMGEFDTQLSNEPASIAILNAIIAKSFESNTKDVIPKPASVDVLINEISNVTDTDDKMKTSAIKKAIDMVIGYDKWTSSASYIISKNRPGLSAMTKEILKMITIMIRDFNCIELVVKPEFRLNHADHKSSYKREYDKHYSIGSDESEKSFVVKFKMAAHYDHVFTLASRNVFNAIWGMLSYKKSTDSVISPTTMPPEFTFPLTDSAINVLVTIKSATNTANNIEKIKELSKSNPVSGNDDMPEIIKDDANDERNSTTNEKS